MISGNGIHSLTEVKLSDARVNIKGKSEKVNKKNGEQASQKTIWPLVLIRFRLSKSGIIQTDLFSLLVMQILINILIKSYNLTPHFYV